MEAERSGKERPTPGPAPSKEIYYIHMNKIKRGTNKNLISKTNLGWGTFDEAGQPRRNCRKNNFGDGVLLAIDNVWLAAINVIWLADVITAHNWYVTACGGEVWEECRQ